MTRTAITISLILVLAACGGGSGGGHGGSVIPGGNPSDDFIPGSRPETSDLTITSLPDSVDNKSEIIAYAESALGDITVAQSEPALVSGRRVTNRAASIWDNVGTDDKYNLVLAEYKNMYKVALGQELADNAVMHAYLLAGGSISDYDWRNLTDDNRDKITEYVHDRYEEILRRFFCWTDDKPSWEYKRQNLADMQLNTIGDRSFGFGDTHVKISQATNGRVEKITLVDDNDEGLDRYGAEYNLVAKDGKYQSQTIYYYELPYKTQFGWGALSFGSDTELTTAQVKEKFISELKRYNDNPDSERLALIESLTDNDKRISSAYDVEDQYTDADIGKYFVSPRNLTMNLEVYGKQTGLQFSDFGKISGKFNVGDKSYDRSYLFTGGYDIKSVDKADMHGEMKFHGNAVAQVMHHYSDNDGIEQSYLDLASAADLVFNDGVETLTMNFADNTNPQNRWYNVRFESDADGKTARMYLTDGDKITAENGKYKFTGADTAKTYELSTIANLPSITTYISPDDNTAAHHIEEAGFQTTYYGNNGNPSEVSGKVSLRQQNWSDDMENLYNNELYFFGAFGAVRDK